MSHKYQKSFTFPANFQDVLKDFTREVLRVQPPNIYQFGYEFFLKLSQEMQEENKLDIEISKVQYKEEQGEVAEDNESFTPLSNEERDDYNNDSAEEIEEREDEELRNSSSSNAHNIISFENISEEGDVLALISNNSEEDLIESMKNYFSQSLKDRFVPFNVARELFKRTFNNKLPEAMSLFAFSEIYITDDGNVDSMAFAEKAGRVLKFLVNYEMFRKGFDIGDIELHLVHGLNKLELEEELKAIFERADENQSGVLHFSQFKKELEEAELDLTERELNIILSEVEMNQELVMYEEIIPKTHHLLFIAEIFEEWCQENDVSF
ncbi:hypothetical protein ABK040_008175 [Willaertia magna]